MINPITPLLKDKQTPLFNFFSKITKSTPEVNEKQWISEITKILNCPHLVITFLDCLLFSSKIH